MTFVREEGTLRKLLNFAIIWLLCLSMLSMLTSPVVGWWGDPAIHHKQMTQDALKGLGWADEEIGSIPEHANNVDKVSPHPENSCHRIRAYQDEFQNWGGNDCICIHKGAEWHASDHINMSHESYAEGIVSEAQKHLGYAIHYIQDALCPSHVFPFLEGEISPHTSFELHSALNYDISDWPSLVRNAGPITITGPDDLRVKIVKIAGLMRAVTENYTSYVRQDGIEVGNPPLEGWYISDEHIGMWMEKAASLVKGAALWATSTLSSMSTHAWPMFQHDPQRTGRSPYVGPDSTKLRVQTLFEVATGTYNGPIVNVAIGLDGTIYFRGSAHGRGTGLFAIHPNGTEKWFLKFDTHASEGGHPTLGPDGTIYCQSSDEILAVNPNGTLRWQKAVATLYYRQHFATSEDGILYFVAGVVLPTNDSRAPCMVALNADGTLVWVFDMKNDTVWHLSPDYDMEQGWGTAGAGTDELTSPSIGPDGTIYIGYKGTIWSINPNGTRNWQETVPEVYFRSGGPVISSDGIIYIATSKLYAINPTGYIQWHTNLTGEIRSHPAMGPDGTLYTFESRWSPSYGKFWLTAIDAQGEVKWQNYTGSAHGIPIVDKEGNVFTALYSIAGPYEVAGFSPSGDLLWKLRLPEQIVSTTGLALNQEGTLFVPGIELYAIQAGPHDTAITSITFIKTIIGEGCNLQIDVSIENQGDFHENFNVSAYANTTLIETQNENLANGTSTVLTFIWSTSGMAYDHYTISVYVWPVQGEKDISDNAYIGGMVFVTITGDVNGDRTVNASDLFDLSGAYGSAPEDPNRDLNGDGKVDAVDLFYLSKNYGKTT